MGLHIDSGLNIAGATCVRAADDTEKITRRYWFDQSEMGRLVFVAEVHVGNGTRSYVERSGMMLPSEVAERACDYTGANMIVERDGKVLYEKE